MTTEPTTTEEFQEVRSDRKRKRNDEEKTSMEIEENSSTTTPQFPQLNASQLKV